MRRVPHNPGQWPRFMRAETAAAYCDEVSTEAFRRKVGTIYPPPITGMGRPQKWDREELKAAGARPVTEMPIVLDAASVL